MTRTDISLEQLAVLPVHLWNRQWLLLAAGDFRTKDFNFMTVGWGGFGAMWARPFALVVVRPTRYTMSFMDKANSFTLSALPEEHRRKLSWAGSHSGRDGDKVKGAGVTPIASRSVSAPGFDEAELILECRKTYWNDMDPSHFLDESIEEHYPNKDYHRIYFGEIVCASGTARWRGGD